MTTPVSLGECILYLGVLNYFFTVDESTPVVSRIGTEIGRLRLRITPYVVQRASTLDEEEFLPYERVDADSTEEQVYEYMDRSLQYRVELSHLKAIASQRFSHVSLRYAFFRETTTQTPKFRLNERGDSGPLGLEFRHVVDVSDALVKYLSDSTLSVEVTRTYMRSQHENVFSRIYPVYPPQEHHRPTLNDTCIDLMWCWLTSKTTAASNCKFPSFHMATSESYLTMVCESRPFKIFNIHFKIAMGTRNVDVLWQEMEQENEYRGVDVTRLLKKSMATGGTSKNVVSSKASVSRRVAHATATHSNADPSDSTSNKHEEIFSLPKVINRLSSEQRSVRKKAALVLELQFLKDNASVKTSAVSDAFSEMAKPLFKRFNDPVEKVREICIRITTKCIVEEEDLLRYLPYLMPAITNRINSQYGYDEENQVFSRDQFLHDAFKRGRVYVAEKQVSRIKPDEPSEEIRLLLLHLVDAVLQSAFERRASSILHAYIFDILLLLISGVHDDFHEINIMSCCILTIISNHMVSVMKHFSVAAVRSLMPLLLHRLARVRIAAVNTIRALVTCPNAEKCKGSGTEAIVDLIGHRDENVIPVASFYTAEVRLNYFAKLDQDGNPMVRRAFFAMIRDWMVNLPDRYDHESRLLPYLLSAVSDEDPLASQDARKTLDVLGERYEQEHGEDVIEIKQYGVDGKNPTYNYQAPLPAPFSAGRPSLGTRLFVRGRARRFLNPILRELANWQDGTRAHAVRLLKCVLVYCEETITVDVHLLVNTLLRTWGGDNELLMELRQCADLTGRFAAPRTYLPLLLARIRGDSDVVVPLAATVDGSATVAIQTAVALEVLHYLLQGSLDKVILPHVPEILDTIALPLILNLESEAVKMALGQILLQITMLLERSGSDAVTALFLQRGRLTSMEKIYSRIFDIAVVVVASSYCSAAVTKASNALKCLTALQLLTNVDQLYVNHSPSLLQRTLHDLNDMLVVQWSAHCAAQLSLEQLLTAAPVPLLLKQGPELNNLFQSNLLPRHPSTINNSPVSAVEENARKSRCTREQSFERILKGLVERVETELEKRTDPAELSIGSSYVEQWKSLLSTAKAAAA